MAVLLRMIVRNIWLKCMTALPLVAALRSANQPICRNKTFLDLANDAPIRLFRAGCSVEQVKMHGLQKNRLIFPKKTNRF